MTTWIATVKLPASNSFLSARAFCGWNGALAAAAFLLFRSYMLIHQAEGALTSPWLVRPSKQLRRYTVDGGLLSYALAD